MASPRPHCGPGRARGHDRRADTSRHGHPGRPRRGRPSLHRRAAGGVVLGGAAGAFRGRPGGSRPGFSNEHAGPAARPARAAGSRGGAVFPHPQGAHARRLLHIRDRRHARAAPCSGPGSLRRMRPSRSDRPDVGGVTRDDPYDAIVVGSGITGGWAAKELCEKGLKTLVLERGRHVEHARDYVTEWLQPWQLPHRGRGEQELYERDYPIQSKNYAFGETTRHFFVSDREHPYLTPDDQPFRWIRGYQLGGRSLIWGRLCWRWSDLDFAANLKDGHGVDCPIRYKDLAPWYAHVERFVGVSGERLRLAHLPEGEFLPA